MSTPRRMEGRVAVVTGAAQGLGQAYARRLASEGAQVCVADRQDGTATVQSIAGSQGGAFAHRCDLRIPQEVAGLADAVHERFGRCDILVNNAGIYPIAPFEQTTLETWREVMSVNLDAVFLTCQAFLPGMRARGYGRVVNVTTTIPWLVVGGFSAYCASKMGVIGLTRALASEYGEHGITVNAAAPNLTRTPTTESGPQAEMFAHVAASQAIKRTELPEDMVGTVAFLASDDAAFMSGQTLFTDGGQIRL